MLSRETSYRQPLPCRRQPSRRTALSDHIPEGAWCSGRSMGCGVLTRDIGKQLHHSDHVLSTEDWKQFSSHWSREYSQASKQVPLALPVELSDHDMYPLHLISLHEGPLGSCWPLHDPVREQLQVGSPTQLAPSWWKLWTGGGSRLHTYHCWSTSPGLAPDRTPKETLRWSLTSSQLNAANYFYEHFRNQNLEERDKTI